MNRLYGPGPTDPPRLIPSADLSGLSTTDVEDRPVGELFGTLAEEETGLIRYLDVSLRGADRHVLVPIGHTRIDRESVPPRVRLRAASFEDLMSVPAYEPDETALDRDYQDRLLHAHGRLFYGSRYYAHPAYDHRGVYTHDQPVHGGDGGAEPEARIRPLSELPDFQVARGEADIRGWPLQDRRERAVGEVAELLVDPGAMKVRYVVIALDEPARSAVLPVGYLEIDREEGETFTPALTHEDIRLLPAYEPPLTRAEENRIQATLEGRLTGDRYFHRPDFRTD